MKFAVFVLVAIVGSALAAVDQSSGNTTVLGDIVVTGALHTTSLRSQALTIDGSISVVHSVTAESINANKADVTVLETTHISSPSGVVRIAGQFASGDISANDTVAVTSFIQNDVAQWAIFHHEDFEQQPEGWNTKHTSSCDGNDHHLAGHCKEIGDELTKVFGDLPAHTHIRVQARYHFFDSWEGEAAFAKIDNKVVWTDTNDVRGMDMASLCGGSSPDGKMSVPIDVTMRHTADSLKLSFGATLDEHPCNESFGIDDVMISVR